MAWHSKLTLVILIVSCVYIGAQVAAMILR